ncbi:MAG: hypothetical protein HYV90_01910 [Candidatus Woesebacteria bacterium]|nr:MAG: hypothetical protein HYV90_01910 [Candidatus Woesebacteria bacterium]
MLEFEPIIPVNFPEGHGEKPWCPHTKLIQIGASLAGIDLDPNTFCGEKMTNTHYSDGVIHYLEAATYYPTTSCKDVHVALLDQVQLVEQSIEEPNIKEFEMELETAVSSREKAAISDKFAEKMGNYQKREDTIERWRKTMFKISFSEKGDEPNPHFRQFDKPEDIPFEEIIGKVKDFIGALERVTGYKPATFSGLGGAKNCPQSPRFHQYNRI